MTKSKKNSKLKIPKIELKIELTETMKDQRAYKYVLESITKARHDIIFDKIKEKKYSSLEAAANHARPLVLKDIDAEIQIFQKIISNLNEEKQDVVNWDDYGIVEVLNQRISNLQFMQKDL